jgi:hypothetical protein
MTARGPALVLFAGWIVPGGGHFLLGRRVQAAVFFLAVTLTYFAGMALADFGNVSPERHGYYFLAQVFNGGETLLAFLLTRGVVEDHVPRHFGLQTGEIGILYTAVASLLNLIAVMDAYGIAAGISKAPGRGKGEGEPAGEPVEVPAQ